MLPTGADHAVDTCDPRATTVNTPTLLSLTAVFLATAHAVRRGTANWRRYRAYDLQPYD